MTRGHGSTCMFEGEVEESVERDKLVSITGPLIILVATMLLVPFLQCVAEVVKGLSVEGKRK